MKVAVGSDHGGFRLKQMVLPFLRELGYEVEDLGCYDERSVDYPDFARLVCEKVVSGAAERGILFCGTGIGMSIAANKMKGIRCALVHDLFSAQATRDHNDTNVLAMGERVIGPGVAQEIARVWLETPFSGGERHVRRIAKVTEIEQEQLD